MPALADQPPVLRHGVYGALGLGVPGAGVGLVLGLTAHPATAWFAVLEVGVPAAHLGLVLGLVSGLLATAARRVRQRSRGDRFAS